MDLVQIKKSIADILNKEGVRHTYHVDDRIRPFESNVSAILAQLNKIESFKNELVLCQIFSDFEIDFDEENEFIVNSINRILIPENSVLISQLIEYFNLNQNQDAEDGEDNDASEIYKYFPDKEFSALAPGEAVDIITKKIGSIGANGKVLVLFDFDLKEAGGEFTQITGAELLIRLKQKDNNNQCICSIFTHLVKDTNEEILKRNKIIESQSEKLDKINLFVLAKKRKRDPNLFGDGIKKVVLNPHYEKVKSESLTLLKNAFNNSFKEIESIDTYEFDHMILQASNIEGVWAGETLLRIFKIIFDKNIRQEFVDNNYAERVNPFFEKAIKLAKHSFPIQFEGLPDLNKSRIRTLELYTGGNLLNALFEPINNGDIFEIQSGQERHPYILVAQECDIVLRSDGKRNRKNDFFTLLKIDYKSKEDVKREIEQFTQTYGLKNHYFSNKFLLHNINEQAPEIIGVIDFRNELMVYASILDLVSFNTSGDALFNISAPYPIVSFSQALRHRFKTITRLCEGKVNFLEDTRKQLNDEGVKNIDSIIKKLVETISPTNKSLGNLNPFTNGEFDFGITRTKRLNTNWANKLLEKYGYYLSRSADLPDYSDEIRVKDLKTTW